MSAQDTAALARRLWDSINAHDVEAGAALIAHDCVYVEVPTGATYHGPDGWRENFRFWMGAFPDASVEITNLVATERGVAVEYVGRGTNTGAMVTTEGEIPATGRAAEMRFCDVLEIEGGRVASGRSYYDLGGLMSQLGLASRPSLGPSQRGRPRPSGGGSPPA